MIQLPLNTPSERSAALLALHAYVMALDGADPFNRPDVGAAPAQVLPPVLPPVAAPAPAQVPPPAPAFEGFSAPLPAGAMMTPPAEDPPMPAFGTAAYAEKVLNGQHEVDIHGEVWDPAKHSSTKAKNADGSWSARRNRTAAAPDPVLPPAPPVAAAPVLPPVPPAPPVAAAAAPVTVDSVIEYAVGLMSAAKAPGPTIADCFSRAGVPNGIAGLAGAPEKAAEVMAHLKALG